MKNSGNQDLPAVTGRCLICHEPIKIQGLGMYTLEKMQKILKAKDESPLLPEGLCQSESCLAEWQNSRSTAGLRAETERRAQDALRSTRLWYVTGGKQGTHPSKLRPETREKYANNLEWLEARYPRHTGHKEL
jgi:hypothetical protein